jgi:hypothetical protein
VHFDLVLLVGLPLLVSGIAFTIAARRESRHQQARRAGGAASHDA